MGKLVYFLFLFPFFRSFAQDTVYLKEEYDSLPVISTKANFYKIYDKSVSPIEVNLYHKNGIKIAKYHVNSNNLHNYNGDYESYYYNGIINLKGVFVENKMEGDWYVYNKETGFIEEKRSYVNNLQQGKTYILYENGKPKRIETYDNDFFISAYCLDTSGLSKDCYSLDHPDVLALAEVMPQFPGGTSALYSYLQHSIRYPAQARENGLQGKVIVRFYVDTDGSVKDPMIIKDETKSDCAQEAIRVCNSMPKWTPGSDKGKFVKVSYTLPITFKVQN
ncbi:MAG: outer rane transport energization protein TonB [Bacteroidota bacterium]|nr:outer rane transport energization protein TonB [Bacteroidota bacterium]